MEAELLLEYQKTIQMGIRDVKDYPKEGIIFKDITPMLFSPDLVEATLEALVTLIDESVEELDAIAAVESRGFLFGMLLAQHFGIPFIPIRKAGKLPFHKVSKSYQLEYGEAVIEMHNDVIKPGMNVLIHDDLLATAGTACAAAELIKEQGGLISGFAFIIELGFLKGREKLLQHSDKTVTILNY